MNTAIDYKRLDDVLKFLNKQKGYKGWKHYKDVSTMEHSNTIDTHYSTWGNILLGFGLVNYQYDGNLKHTYIITYKGIDVIDSGKSTKDVHEEIKKKEKLDEQILLATLESHNTAKESTKTAKKATNLNVIQLVVTVLLGFVTFASIFFQYKSNELAERAVKVAEQAHQLELDNKESIDTIFVKLDSLKAPIADNKNNKK